MFYKSNEEAVNAINTAYLYLVNEIKHANKEISEWTSYAESICKAHGMEYSGSGPEDPGPDPNDFDIWAVQQLKNDSDKLKKIIPIIKDIVMMCPEGGRAYRYACKAAKIASSIN